MKKFFKKYEFTIMAIFLVVAILGTAAIACCVSYDNNKINTNTYCSEGIIIEATKNEYVVELNNGHRFSFLSNEQFMIDTVVNVCLDMGETDAVKDDKIIAISVDNYALAESLFDEWLLSLVSLDVVRPNKSIDFLNIYDIMIIVNETEW